MTPADLQTADQARPSILVVDDETVIIEALTATLGGEGYEVVTAADTATALRRLEEKEFALVLTDQRMPQMTGLELLGRVQQTQPDATRVLMTGVLDLGTIIDCINKGELYRFIVKPWLREELLATVRNGTHRYELIRHNARLQRTTQEMNARLIELNQSLERQVARETEQNRQLAELNRALEQNLHRSVELCLQTMQTFYPRLGAQARRVHELCQSLAVGMRFSDEERRVFEIAGWLHDIGLMGVPRRLITLWQKSPHLLNRNELAILQQHPVLGQELAGFVQDLAGVGLAIRSHHERFDGAGYPDHLVGEEIPWLARLLAVVTEFTECEIKGVDGLDVLRQASGTAYDPEAVRVFIRHRPQSGTPRREREVPLSELSPGMILAKGIYTSNGMLLMPEGQVLSEPAIAKLRNHNRVNPIRQTLVVYC
jgi:response regulator RpfG family c-di-GMP phosphodiesterase